MISNKDNLELCSISILNAKLQKIIIQHFQLCEEAVKGYFSYINCIISRLHVHLCITYKYFSYEFMPEAFEEPKTIDGIGKGHGFVFVVDTLSAPNILKGLFLP